MIISKKHGFAFIHNPKACGTSVRNALSKYHDHPINFWHQGWLKSDGRVVDLAHLAAVDWLQYVPKGTRTFGFVRDPYTRFKSAMAEFQRRHGAEFSVVQTLNALNPASIRWDWRFIHFCPQHYFFYFDGVRVVDSIFRMENIHNDWEPLTASLGIESTLPKSRVSPESEFEVTDNIRRLVEHLYYRDFIMLNQLFGSPVVSTPTPFHYSQRVEAIHTPELRARLTNTDGIPFTSGELVALVSKPVVI